MRARFFSFWRNLFRHDRVERTLNDELRRFMATAFPELPVLDAGALDGRSGSPAEQQLRLAGTVAAAVGLVGVLLAAMGVYGVAAYTVARRTREIGIRLAMGASRAAVVGLVLRQGMTLVGIGCAVGLVMGATVSRLFASQRFGALTPDVLTYARAAVLFGLVGLVACYLPVRRASRIRTIDALRYE